MKKNLTNILLILISAFAFTSCGDSKEAVVDDMISLMKETKAALASGDQEARAKLVERSKAIQKRAKALGIDPNDPSTLPPELQTKMQEAGKKMMSEVIDKAIKNAT